MRRFPVLAFLCLVPLVTGGRAAAQQVPADYRAFLEALGRTGDYKEGVLKVNIPRGDLAITIRGRRLPTPFGFGGWVALTKDAAGLDVMMGDLALTEDEVNPVLSALVDHGLEVTALHNHFFWEAPRIFYLHVSGHGRAADLAARLKPAVAIIDASMKRAGAATPAPPVAPLALDTKALAAVLGQEGEQSGGVYKITLGRPDIDVRAHGVRISARMGLNTWAAFTGTNEAAVVAGDVAMLEGEVLPVLKTLRAHGIDVVAIHHHMIGAEPPVIFLHYFGSGPAVRLAEAVKAAVDQTGKSAKIAGP